MDDQFSPVLVQVCRAFRNRVEAELNRVGLHAGQEALLLHLADHSGCTLSELAESLCVEAPTVTKTIQRLERAGMVERVADPDDGRVSRISLTPAGEDVIAPIRETWRSLESVLLKGISPAEQLLVRRILQQMHENLTS